MYGLRELRAVRCKGIKPESVYLYTDGRKVYPWWRYSDVVPEVSMRPSDDVVSIDWRPFVGLDVIVLANRIGLLEDRAIKALSDYAGMMLVQTLDEDLSFCWTKNKGVLWTLSQGEAS